MPAAAASAIAALDSPANRRAAPTTSVVVVAARPTRPGPGCPSGGRVHKESSEIRVVAGQALLEVEQSLTFGNTQHGVGLAS